jgi:hypothetical protein
MSAETSASVRPTSGMSPAWSWAATRSAAAPALRSASISSGALTARSGPVIVEASTKDVVGRRRWRPSTNRAQVWSPTAAVPAGPTSPATRSRGSSSSPQVRNEKTSGRSTTRGASSTGTTRVASPSRGTTSMVSRSSGIAS